MKKSITAIALSAALVSGAAVSFALAQAKKPAAPSRAGSPPPASVAKGDASAVTEEFVSYMKRAYNPPTHNLGLRDGRYFPYMTPFGGRRIGYRSVIREESLYRTGWSVEEADAQLRADLAGLVDELRAQTGKRVPAKPFDALPQESREILIDFAYSEGGAAKISDLVCKAIVAQDWKTLIDGMIYVRSASGSPDNTLNRAFADRWIYSKKLAR